VLARFGEQLKATGIAVYNVLARFGEQLKATGIAVYNVLARFANREGVCFPSQATIARLTGLSRMQVSREIKKLEHLKLIAIEHTFGDNGQQCVNRYTLLDVSPEEGPVTHRYTPCNRELHPPVTESDTPRHRQLHEQDTSNKTQAEQDPTETDVVVALVNQGISERVARELAKKHSKAHIEEKLEYLAFMLKERPEHVLKPCGWLRKAIEEDYAAPDGYKTAEERAAEEIEAKLREEEAQQLIAEQQKQVEAEQERECQEEATKLAELHRTFGTTQEEIDLWNPLLQEFKLTMPAGSFFEYVADTVLLSLKDGEALIGLPNARARDWMENRFAVKISRTLSSCLGGKKVTVKFIDLQTAHEPLAVSQAGTR
jgi:hypothetical protein